MQIVGCFFLFVIFCFSYQYCKWCFLGSYEKGNAPNLGFLNLKNGFLGIGFLVFGYVFRFLNGSGLSILFGYLGLKTLQFVCQFKGLRQASDSIDELCSKDGFAVVCGWKFLHLPWKCHSLEILKISESDKLDNLVESEESVDISPMWSAEDEEFDSCDDDSDGSSGEFCNGDVDSDVVQLRNLLEIERKRANAAYRDLEKEQMAAASSAEEAMRMIMRLQNEKSLIEIEAQNYRKVAEQKQLYDEQVIQCLRWLVSRHEVDRSRLEERLRMCRQRLKLHSTSNEIDEFEDFASIFSSSDN